MMSRHVNKKNLSLEEKGQTVGWIHSAWETAHLDRESFQGWLLKWKSNRPLSEAMWWTHGSNGPRVNCVNMAMENLAIEIVSHQSNWVPNEIHSWYQCSPILPNELPDCRKETHCARLPPPCSGHIPHIPWWYPCFLPLQGEIHLYGDRVPTLLGEIPCIRAKDPLFAALVVQFPILLCNSSPNFCCSNSHAIPKLEMWLRLNAGPMTPMALWHRYWRSPRWRRRAWRRSTGRRSTEHTRRCGRHQGLLCLMAGRYVTEFVGENRRSPGAPRFFMSQTEI